MEPELIQKAEVPDPVESNENKAERPERVKKTFTSASTKDQEDTGSPFLLRPRKENEKVTAAELIKESKETVKDDVQDEDYFIRKMKERVLSYHNRSLPPKLQTEKRFSVQMNRKTKLLNMSNTPLKQQIRQLHRKLRQQFKNPNQRSKCKLPPPAPMQHLIVK